MKPIEKRRLESLDALRGFDMLFIMGLPSVLIALSVAFGFGRESFICRQMRHVAWHGLAMMDTVFPLFLFIAGVTFPFSLSKQKDAGISRRRIALRCLKRGITLTILGLVYEDVLTLDFAHFRVWSVLGRIGCAWMVASWIYMSFRRRLRFVIAVAVLVGCWLFTRLVLAPDAPMGADPFSAAGNFGCWLDRTLTAGHIYDNLFDPEGFAGFLPSVVTALLGMFAGEFLNRESVSGAHKTVGLFLVGIGCAFGAWLMSFSCPVNKSLWTSSFVLAVGSYSFIALGVFYWVVDVLGFKRWAFPLKVVGMNSITIYLAQRIIGFNEANRFLFGGLAGLFPPTWRAVVSACTYMIICWAFLYFLYRRNIFIKV